MSEKLPKTTQFVSYVLCVLFLISTFLFVGLKFHMQRQIHTQCVYDIISKLSKGPLILSLKCNEDMLTGWNLNLETYFDELWTDIK